MNSKFSALLSGFLVVIAVSTVTPARAHGGGGEHYGGGEHSSGGGYGGGSSYGGGGGGHSMGGWGGGSSSASSSGNKGGWFGSNAASSASRTPQSISNGGWSNGSNANSNSAGGGWRQTEQPVQRANAQTQYHAMQTMQAQQAQQAQLTQQSALATSATTPVTTPVTATTMPVTTSNAYGTVYPNNSYGYPSNYYPNGYYPNTMSTVPVGQLMQMDNNIIAQQQYWLGQINSGMLNPQQMMYAQNMLGQLQAQQNSVNGTLNREMPGNYQRMMTANVLSAGVQSLVRSIGGANRAAQTSVSGVTTSPITPTGN